MAYCNSTVPLLLPSMTRKNWSAIVGVFVILACGDWNRVQAKDSDSPPASVATEAVDLFKAIDSGQVDVKFIAMSDHAARVLVSNKTKQPLNLKLPEAFAGVPVLAQLGGAGGGRRGGGGFGGGGRTTGGGGQQSVGGGGGGGLGGGGLGGGGGGLFSVPPEQTAKLDVPVVCLDHGLRDPSSSAPYKMVPADEHVDRPAVVELLKAFGRGELQHGAAQAAAWHLNNDMSWDQLAAKLQGTRRSLRRPPYFSADEIRAGVAYANAATQLAAVNSEKNPRDKTATEEKAAKPESSEARSTTDDANEPTTKSNAAEHDKATNDSAIQKI
jgi:hypothetical protein